MWGDALNPGALKEERAAAAAPGGTDPVPGGRPRRIRDEGVRRMSIRNTGVWAGFLLTVGLTGCAGSGTNPNFQRAGAPAASRLNPPVAATAANNSGWARQPQTPATRPAGDPSALAAPTGNTPQFSNQPTGGITPAGGIAPPAVPSAGAPV